MPLEEREWVDAQVLVHFLELGLGAQMRLSHFFDRVFNGQSGGRSTCVMAACQAGTLQLIHVAIYAGREAELVLRSSGKSIVVEKKLLYHSNISMAKIYAESNWMIKVLNGEHPPVHVHVRTKAMSNATITVYRIAAVAALPGSRLRVEYLGGNAIEVDLSALIAKSRVMRHLANPARFNAVHVGDYGWTVIWDEDAELSSDRLMEMALEQQGRTDALEFRRWQERNHLSLSEAAEAIGLTRRTISQYRTGARPVPRTVTLACKGWEAERSQGR